MANYFRTLISNKDMCETVALALIAIVLLMLAYFAAALAISNMPAPLGSFEALLKP